MRSRDGGATEVLPGTMRISEHEASACGTNKNPADLRHVFRKSRDHRDKPQYQRTTFRSHACVATSAVTAQHHSFDYTLPYFSSKGQQECSPSQRSTGYGSFCRFST